ncbi:MAG: PAS domain-containing sensor histidine kinase [Planctomycetota bacterium]
MTRFWNLQTKFVAVLIVLLLGALSTQSYFNERSKERLFDAVLGITEDVANEATRKVSEVVMTPPTLRVQASRVTLRDAGEQVWSSRRVRQGNRAEGRAQERIVLHMQVANLVENHALLGATAAAAPIASEGAAAAMSEVPDPEVGVVAADRPQDSRCAVTEPLVFPTLPGGLTANVADPMFVFYLTPSPSTRPTVASIDLTPHAERVEAIFEEYRRKDFLAMVGVFLLGMGLAWFLGARIVRPMHTLTRAFQEVADGDLETRVPDGQRGEFGVLGKQFNAMVGRVRENLELQRALERRERVQHMGDLAAGVAHDVRNPLNAIHLNIGHMRDQFAPSDEAQRARYLRHMSDVQREVERLNQLVTNFLSLAQPSSGDVEAVSLGEIAQGLARLLEKEAASRHVSLELQLAADLPLVEGNGQELKSAFLNIAMNALQAMEPHGGGRLEIVTERHAPAVDATDGVEAVAVRFRDSGIGIPAADLDRIFVPYFTLRSGGTGLGTTIAQRIAERYGGRIEVHSEVGQGTEVSFVFPVQSAAAEVG